MNRTNRIIILGIIGLIIAWFVGGLIGGITSSFAIGISMMVVIFSGVLGQRVAEKVGGAILPIALGAMFFGGTWGDWWKWAASWCVAVFIGYILSTFRPRDQENYELKYNFKSEEDKFSVSFPKEPKIEHDSSSTTYNVIYQGDIVYSILVSYDSFTMQESKNLYDKLEGSEKLKEIQRKELQKQLEIQSDVVDKVILNDNQASFLGFPSYNSLIQNAGYYYSHTCFYVGDCKYVISVGHSDKEIVQTVFKNFSDSFKLIQDKIKK